MLLDQTPPKKDTNTQHLGCVVYVLSTNGIESQWVYTGNHGIERGTGTGHRTSPINKKRKFEGSYDIEYIDAHGDKSPTLQLRIEYALGMYSLTWELNNKITEVGIGIENGNTLCVSYKKAT